MRTFFTTSVPGEDTIQEEQLQGRIAPVDSLASPALLPTAVPVGKSLLQQLCGKWLLLPHPSSRRAKAAFYCSHVQLRGMAFCGNSEEDGLKHCAAACLGLVGRRAMGINKQSKRMNACVRAPWKSPGCQCSLPREELKAAPGKFGQMTS